tara:strand:+ start:395 stop:1501 length:1107 start_codon:yes stop_codon:yes gene_type:complete
MAVYKIFPTQDTTLYSIYPEMNTGLDEILEASLEVGALTVPAPQASRFLIQFSSDEITDVVNNKISNSQWQSNLRCFIADVTALNATTTLEIYPVSQSWNMGTGKYLNVPETQNGTSWIWRNYQGGTMWTTISFAANSTGSYSSSVSPGGGTWYTNYSSSQQFDYYSDKDINVDVTDITSAWYSASVPNDGFIVKQQTEFIDDEDVQPKIKYFSIDTHTIYPPCLEFRWDDYIFDTGSSANTILGVSPFVVTIGDNLGYFYLESINKFRVYSRPEYPARTFSTSSYFTQNYYLPTASYYAIKDLDTNEYVVDFDSTYTKLSLDTTSSYFNLYMNGLQPERYYKILIKTTVNGNTVVMDNDYYFKIING